MDSISQKYQEESQKQLVQIEQATVSLHQKCDELRIATEQKIASLNQQDADYQNKVNLLKLQLKRDLDTLIEQYEHDLKNNFRSGIVNLEDIYHEKEISRLKELEQEVLKY